VTRRHRVAERGKRQGAGIERDVGAVGCVGQQQTGFLEQLAQRGGEVQGILCGTCRRRNREAGHCVGQRFGQRGVWRGIDASAREDAGLGQECRPGRTPQQVHVEAAA
jgi:hypothetical protein